MFHIEIDSVTINIHLEHGIYRFLKKSSTGKSRLYHLLVAASVSGFPATGYTYQDYVRGLDISTILVPEKYQVILLDRYDLYKGIGADRIRECASSSIILMDCKDVPMISKTVPYCRLKMSESQMEVF